MKFLFTLTVIVFLFINHSQAEEHQQQIITRTLSNGLQVLIYEKHTVPVVSVQVWYHVGSVDEPNGLKGIAHLFEHMMFRGSKNFGPEEHFKLINMAGGSCNAYTSDETTVYFEELPADKLDLALRLEADRMAWLKLNQNVLDTERQVVMEEYRMRVDNDPIGSIEKDGREFLFAGTPFEYGPIGKMQDIKNFTVKDCEEFYNKYYAPNNATLIIVGDIKADKAIEMVKSRFGSIRPSEVASRAPLLNFKMKNVAAVAKSKTELPVPVVVLSFYTGGARDKDRAALQVLLNCLADGKSSRLWRTLVNNKKVAEYFTGEYIEGENEGLVILGAAYLPGMGKKVEKNMWKEIEKIKKSGLEPDEFEKAVNQMRSATLFEKYYVNQLASEIGSCAVIRGNYKLFYELDKEIEAVTQQDVIRVANKYFVKDNSKKMYFEPRQQMLLAVIAGICKSIF